MDSVTSTCDSTANNVKSILGLLSNNAALPKVSARTPTKATPDASLPIDKSADVDDILPMFRDVVDGDVHALFCSTFSIAKTRRDMPKLVSYVKDEQPVFSGYWARVQNCKSVAQWNKKLVNLGATLDGEDLSEDSLPNYKEIGDYIYSRLTDDGSLAEVSMQAKPN